MTNSISQNPTGPDWESLGLSLPTNKKSEELSFQEISKLLTKDAIAQADPLEIEVLKSTLTIAAHDPKIPSADKKAIETFIANLQGVDTRSSSTSSITAAGNKAKNDWMNVSAVVDLFCSVNLIAMLISRMARSESVLRQALGEVMLNMAKTSMDLTIQAGEARAQQFELEAQKCWLEFGMALGQIAVTTMTTFVAYAKEQGFKAQMPKGADGKVSLEHQFKAHQIGHESTMPLNQISSSFLTAIKSALEAGINMEKAQLERDAALADGVKQLLDKIYQLLNDTYNTLGEDMKDQRQFIDKLMQMLEAAQKTQADQWKA